MEKMPVCLVQRSVKTSRNIEVETFLIHAAKVGFYFGFEKWDFGFGLIFLILYLPAANKCLK
ncbi:hypothetical protein JN11_00150 [Mucilaginibacter frigoritolerans]|uniref:Uncharacterized protein n=1 Tax=Mucilaginibacter frigoritolerans TaxID=652788 RepID=A0A562UHA5_9SPHI|nr:hypothetical protein JN11_00150 [Mucilaginibacter frigoritolerans]